MTISNVHSPAPVSLLDRYAAVRRQTEALAAPLETEDYVVSSMPDVSPTKWHLAHTSWFFETFVLAPFDERYVTPNPKYAFLFNSYYVQAGERTVARNAASLRVRRLLRSLHIARTSTLR